MVQYIGLPGVALALALLFPWPGHGAVVNCDSAVKEQLSLLNILPADVAEISYLPRTSGRRGGDRIIGYDAWINLKSCKGSLIVAFSRNCGVQQVYARNKCEFPGVASY